MKRELMTCDVYGDKVADRTYQVVILDVTDAADASEAVEGAVFQDTKDLCDKAFNRLKSKIAAGLSAPKNYRKRKGDGSADSSSDPA